MITTTGPPERHPPSGIDVLVVGGGLGGLVAAVELYRHGHDVRIIESKAGIEELGKTGLYRLAASWHRTH